MLSIWKKIVFFVCLAVSAKATVYNWGPTASGTAGTWEFQGDGVYVVHITSAGSGPAAGIWPAVDAAWVPNGQGTMNVYTSGSTVTVSNVSSSGFYLLAAVDQGLDTTIANAYVVSKPTPTGEGNVAPATREVSYTVNVTNTSLQTRTINVTKAGAVIATQTVAPYDNVTLSGVTSASDGVEIATTATDTLRPKSGAAYDPFLVSAANTVMVRDYYCGNDPADLVTVSAVVQVNNLGTAASWVKLSVGGLELGKITVPAGQLSNDWLKVSVPLPVGSVITVSSENGHSVVLAPASATVARNNVQMMWVVSLTGPAYQSPYSEATVTGTEVTNYSNGQTITQTPGGGVTVVNPTTLPTTGQTFTPPTGTNGQPIITGGTGTAGTPGTTVITGTGTGTGSGAADTGLLQQIATNTGKLDGLDAGTLPTETPDESLLTRFQPDSGTSAGLSGLNPIAGKGIPSGVAPSISLPFGSLGVDGLADGQLEFSTANLSTWAGVIRLFFLFVISVFFTLHLIRIVSKTVGNI